MGLVDTGGFADAVFGLEAAFETGFCAACAMGAVLTLPESAVLAAGFLDAAAASKMDAALAFAGAAVFAAAVAGAFFILGAADRFCSSFGCRFFWRRRRAGSGRCLRRRYGFASRFRSRLCRICHTGLARWFCLIGGDGLFDISDRLARCRCRNLCIFVSCGLRNRFFGLRYRTCLFSHINLPVSILAWPAIPHHHAT